MNLPINNTTNHIPLSPFILPQAATSTVNSNIQLTAPAVSGVASSPQQSAVSSSQSESKQNFPIVPSPLRLPINSESKKEISSEKSTPAPSPVIIKNTWRSQPPQNLTSAPLDSCPEHSSAADMAYLSSYALPSSHVGIICDKQREKNWSGGRYKCVNCKNYDLCGDCELVEYECSMGLRADRTVMFQCPYEICHKPGLIQDKYTEIELLKHVNTSHATENNLVVCPVCAVNGSSGIIMAQPKFGEHLSKDHCDPHDPKTHTMMHIPAMLPHFLERKFVVVNPFPFLPDSETKYESSEQLQNSVVHVGSTCQGCGTSPIIGKCYTCYHCPDFSLCSSCYVHKDELHSSAHIFLVFRKALDRTSAVIPQLPLFYPHAFLGSCGFNTQTELFFLSLTLYHLGLLRTCSRYTSLQSQLEACDVAALHQYEALLKIQLSVESQLEPMIAPALKLYITALKAMESVIWKNCDKNILPPNLAFSVAALPEFIIEDLADLLVFISKYKRDAIATLSIDEMGMLFKMLVLFLSGSNFLRNPYLRTKLADVFFNLSTSSELSVLYENDSFVLRFLLPSLFDLFNGVEHTGTGSEYGASVQFYDKFAVRFSIEKLILFLLKFWTHQNVMEKYSVEHEEVIMKFINCFLNDLTFLFDEALSKISILQTMAKKKEELSRMNESARSDYISTVSLNERTLKTICTFCNTLLLLIAELGHLSSLRRVALKPEMIARVASSINYFVVKMGEMSTHLSKPINELTIEENELKRAAEFGFCPISYLKDFMLLYLPFAQFEEFCTAVVGDGRSYKLADFYQYLDLLKSHKKLSDQVLFYQL